MLTAVRLGVRWRGMARSNRTREAADALRTAVDKTVQQTLGQATASRGKAQERALDLVDDVSQAATRLRDSLEDLRVATKEDVREVESRLTSIEQRIAALEQAAKAAAEKPSAKRSTKAKNRK